MEITKRTAASPAGDITLYRLVNDNGAWVELSSLGAGIVEVGVPDREGKIENVALSYADPADYLADGPCLGKIPGRYANRIARGYLEIDGNEYQLAINNGPNHLHGGPDGFQNKIWESKELEDGVEFTYVSQDGEENYPGTLTVTATYRWNDKNELALKLHAETTAPTVVNLTNHAYWNLDGADAGTALDHEMKIRASKWLPTDHTQIPTGTLAGVGGSPMDFRMFKRIREDIFRPTRPLQIGKGYDHCWALDSWAPGKLLTDAVELRSDKSGRVMRMSTDQPGVQVYSGNWLSGSAKNKSGGNYADYDGIAIEAQGFPDAPNKPEFPTQRLNPGESYDRTIIFSFDTF